MIFLIKDIEDIVGLSRCQAGAALRNIFDQYSQPENRITHALMTALDQDRILLGRFLRELVNVKAPRQPKELDILEQQYPGEAERSEEELDRPGIPDGWIFDDSGWCVVIESKVIAKLSADQIMRHRRTAERRGFNQIIAVAIATQLPTALPTGTVLLEWRDIYAWLCRRASSSAWANRAARYLEIAETKLIDGEQFVEGTLTKFSGFAFGHNHPYTYLEGKRVLGLALSELKQRRDLRNQIRMNPRAPGRGAITGRQGDSVWDFLSLAGSNGDDAFTNHPHLTLEVRAQAVEAMVTIPNAVDAAVRHKLKALGDDKFQALTTTVVTNMNPLLRKCPGATPWFRGVQRRFDSIKSKPFIDAEINFDLRTAVPNSGPPKAQLQWLKAAYGSFVGKKGSNYQIQMGVVFRYDRCPELANPDAIALVAASWLACKPLIDLAR